MQDLSKEVSVSDINATPEEQERLARDSEVERRDEPVSEPNVDTPPVPENPADNINLDPEANREQEEAHPRGDDFVARPGEEV
jgi:hypothetical protein